MRFLTLKWVGIGSAIVIVLMLAWAMRLDGLRARYKGGLELMAKEATNVVEAVRTASGNPKVEWSNAAGQIIALGESNRQLKGSIEAQNMAIDEMAAEAVRLKAKATELKRIADKAEAQRAAALRKLSNMAITPGTRGDCMKLLREAEDALDLVRSAGA